jgi:hypothetical protein
MRTNVDIDRENIDLLISGRYGNLISSHVSIKCRISFTNS